MFADARRRSYHTVLMLTARDTLANKLEGFGSGADDYLVKPFAMPETRGQTPLRWHDADAGIDHRAVDGR